MKVHTNYPGDIPVISWILQHDQEYTSVGFSILEHPTYLALKINWLLILLFFVNDSKKIDLKSWIYLLLIVFLSVILYLLSSKAGLFLWIILVVAFFVNRILKAHNPFFYIFSIVVFLFVVGITVTQIPRVKRYINSIEQVTDSTQIDWKNLDQRTREWYSAIQLIKEKPVFGHGLAKIEDRMVEEYKKNGWEEEARLRFNAHNQFLEAQMTFGIPGTLSLIWMLITPVLVRKRLKYPKLAVAFTAMMSFFLLFESMFNRQWGIMFFILFYCILLSQFRKNETETKNDVLIKL
ncbi:MAG: O-antigen ligase family protein [Bacteroidales bacterium]|nr:O-antigen ligase family protein [Bacteroidales bacterium]